MLIIAATRRESGRRSSSTAPCNVSTTSCNVKHHLPHSQTLHSSQDTASRLPACVERQPALSRRAEGDMEAVRAHLRRCSAYCCRCMAVPCRTMIT